MCDGRACHSIKSLISKSFDSVADFDLLPLNLAGDYRLLLLTIEKFTSSRTRIELFELHAKTDKLTARQDLFNLRYFLLDNLSITFPSTGYI